MPSSKIERLGREHLKQIENGTAKNCPCGFKMFWKPCGQIWECEVCDNIISSPTKEKK